MRNRTSYSNANMVGQRIRSLREKQGLSQGDLLARIQVLDSNMSQSKLSRIEGQLVPVSDTDLFSISQALHVAIDDLFPQSDSFGTM